MYAAGVTSVVGVTAAAVVVIRIAVRPEVATAAEAVTLTALDVVRTLRLRRIALVVVVALTTDAVVRVR